MRRPTARLNDDGARATPAVTRAACPCWRSAAARSSSLQIAYWITHRGLSVSKLDLQCSQATTDALADDALRAAKFCGDLGVAALVDVVGLDRIALLGSKRLEELDRCGVCRRLEDLYRSSSKWMGCIASARRASSWMRPLRWASLSLWRAIAYSQAWAGSGPG